MKKIFLLVLFFATYTLNAQTSLRIESMEPVNEKPLFHKQTREPISFEEYQKMIESNLNVCTEPVINEYGEVTSYYIDPTLESDENTYYEFNRIPIGDYFHPFIMKTIDGSLIDSNKLKGKYVLICHQLLFKFPAFSKPQFESYNESIAKWKTNHELESIIITQSPKDEITNAIDGEKYHSHIVPNARNFVRKFAIVDSPTYILIDPLGKVVSYYSWFEVDDIDQFFKEH